MGSYAICTISSSSHLFKVRALCRGLKDLTDADIHCLVTDADAVGIAVGASLHHIGNLKGSVANAILAKYRGDELRWACKPLFILHLLAQGYERVIYVDNDVFFFASPDELFGMLQSSSVLLTPHFYTCNPDAEQHWLEASFRVGLYNAGFVGVSSKGMNAMEWWAKCCAYNVRKSAWRGLFDDQRYLDLLPVIFDGIHVLKHQGCNVAGWNIEMSPRSLSDEGKLLLNGVWPLVFVHFNAFTFRTIMKGDDPFLEPYMKRYVDILKEESPEFSLEASTRLGIDDLGLYFRHLLWKLARLLD